MTNTKLENLAYRIHDLKSLRELFMELNFDFEDKPVNKDSWSNDQKQIVSESKLIAHKDKYLIFYIRTNEKSINKWKSITTKIIHDNQGSCMVCAHNPDGVKWVFSSLSKEFSRSFSETRHVPIDIRSNMGVPKNFVEFLEHIRVSDKSKASSIMLQISKAFNLFAVQIQDELKINVFEALKVISEGIIFDKSNSMPLKQETLENIREPVFILLYRMIFILYAEDRGIFPTDNDTYHTEYSFKWIKHELILNEHHEEITEYALHERLWKFFKLIETGSENCGHDPNDFFMKPYYGRLFDRHLNADLNNWKIKNSYLLKTIELLTRTHDKAGNYFFLDYSALETRHLGSIYEHLLEYHLRIDNEKIADLPNDKDRKMSGSYYTSEPIVDYILQNTIGPLIDEIITNTKDTSEKIEKILDLNIIDPAMGSGHFLIGATNYIAKRICALEHDGEISEQSMIKRKRDVARRCIYGVDLNPLAVDLAQVSLWLETLSSEKPLSFLSAHLKSGNSLFGSSIDNILKKQITLNQSVQGISSFKKTVRDFIMLEQLEDDTASEVKTKIEKYEKIRSKGTIYYDLKSLLDAQIAQFFGIDVPPIGDYAQKIGENSIDFHTENSVWKQVKKISKQQSFFHWDLEFPDIFYDADGKRKKNAGFDAVIGNPPWETLKQDRNEFFSPLYEKENPTKKFRTLNSSAKKQFIKKCLKDDKIQTRYEEYKNWFQLQTNYFANSDDYVNQIATVDGKKQPRDSNLYKLFTERSFVLLKNNGLCGMIMPAGIYSDMGSRGLREMLFNNSRIKSLYGFVNRKNIFKDVDSRFKFCILIFQKGSMTKKFSAGFYIDDVDTLQTLDNKTFELDLSFIKSSLPTALSVIECSNKMEMTIIKKLFRHPLLVSDDWNIDMCVELNMTIHDRFFKEEKIGFPLYEGKMINMFTNKFAPPRYWIDSNEGCDILKKKEMNKIKKANKNAQILPKIDSDEYRLAWRTITNSTNERTLISTILPPKVFLGHSLNYLNPIKYDGVKYFKPISYLETIFLCGIFNSFISDFILRHRVSTNISIFHMKDMPIPKFDYNNKYHKIIIINSAKLICITDEYAFLRKQIEVPEFVTNVDKRTELEAEINAAVINIYNLTQKETEFILKGFPLVDENLKNKTLDMMKTI